MKYAANIKGKEKLVFKSKSEAKGRETFFAYKLNISMRSIIIEYLAFVGNGTSTQFTSKHDNTK